MTMKKNVKFSRKKALWNFCGVNKDTEWSGREENAKKSERFLIKRDSDPVLKIYFK